MGRDKEWLFRITMISNPIIPLSPLLQEKVRAVFDNLIQLEHLNIVKFHKYWADIKENKARVRTSSRAYCKKLATFIFTLHPDIKTR